MKKAKQLIFKITFLVFISLIEFNPIFSQAEDYCSITGGGEAAIGALSQVGNFGNSPTNTPKYIKIYVHVIRQPDGSGGQPDGAVQGAIDRLNTDFNVFNIFFITPCEVIDIPVSQEEYIDYELYCDLFENPDYQYNDGISIFFGADDTVRDNGLTDGGGASRNIPSTAMWVAGIWPYYDSGSCISTSTVSHEMGHCLGLWHTHHGTVTEGDAIYCGNVFLGDPDQCCELVDESNGTSCGDYVKDTSADPYHWTAPDCFNVAYSDGLTIPFDACFNLVTINDWPFHYLIDENEDRYTPPASNAMSYNVNLNCRDEFTDGQGNRMHHMIETSSILQACLVQPKIITESTTWTTTNTPNNGNFEISDYLVIESGATLTIEEGVTVRFKEEGKIVIKPNATLTLEGTLTSRVCDNFWQGIEVWGNSSQSQYTIGGVRAQGRLVCNSGATIENAEIAVQLHGQTGSGGQIRCSGATFINNHIAIQFAPYDNYWPFNTSQHGQPRSYFARFSDCTFINDDDYQVSTPFYAFIEMSGVNGVRILGCDFENEQTINASYIQDYGYGIIAAESGFKVDALCTGSTYPCNSFDRSSFRGLGYGIFTSNIIQNRPYILKKTDFSDCYFGLYNSGVSNGTILFNDFSLGNVPDVSITSDQIGILFEMGLAGFTLEENDFIGTSGNVNTTVGTICKSLDQFNNVVRSNTYSNLDYGNVAQGDNATSAINKFDRGLHYLCNINDNVSEANFAVADGFSTDRIRYSQGLEYQDEFTEEILYKATGNQFSYTGIDFNNQGEGIKYYYYPNGVRETPLNYVGDITIAEAEENSCPESYCEPPCKTREEVDLEKEKYYENLSKEEIAKLESEAALASDDIALAELKEKEAAYYRQKMDKEAYMVVVHLKYDTTHYNVDTLATWVENLDVFSMDIIWALREQSNGNYPEAAMAFERAAKRTNLSRQQADDLMQMPVLMSILKGKTPYKVGKQDLTELEKLATVDESLVGNISRNILRVHGYHFSPKYRLPKLRGLPNSITGNTVNQADEEISAYPNPTDGRFNFSWNPINKMQESALLEIRDLSGRLISKQNISPFEQNLIDLEEHQSGVYFYQLIIEGEAPKTGKLILQ